MTSQWRALAGEHAHGIHHLRAPRRAKRGSVARSIFKTGHHDGTSRKSPYLATYGYQRFAPVLKLEESHAASSRASYDRRRARDHRAEPAPAWSALEETVLAWADLPDDWDEAGAHAPERAQVDAAKKFLVRAEEHNLSAPRPYLSPDGEIGFHWDGIYGASFSFLRNRFVGYCDVPDDEPLTVAGPLDIAAASTDLFNKLEAVARVERGAVDI